jgi:hypothetical protein
MLDRMIQNTPGEEEKRREMEAVRQRAHVLQEQSRRLARQAGRAVADAQALLRRQATTRPESPGRSAERH